MSLRSMVLVCGMSWWAMLGCDSQSPSPTPTANDASASRDGSASGADYCRLEACGRPECPVPPGSSWAQCNVDLTLRANDCRSSMPSASGEQLCTCGFGRVSQSCQDLFTERASCLVAHCP